MPDINTINGLTLCDETNVNGVTIANISQIDGVDKSCGECNAIEMVYDAEGCDGACNGEECGGYYVNEVIACPLSVGTGIYNDAACADCAATGFYSSKMCDTACAVCYTFDQGECQITRVTDCR